MLEAMAAGLPVVATSVGDAELLLSNGGGLLVEVKAPDAFALALGNLIRDPEKMRVMGRAARAHAEKNYNSEIWLDKLLTCYTLAQKMNASLEGGS
jgi:glycosyltransferase involved in cell wall biosynthesis